MTPKQEEIVGRFIRDLREVPPIDRTVPREWILQVIGDLGAASPSEIMQADPRIKRSTLYGNLERLESARRIERTPDDRYKRTGVFIPL